MPEIQFLRTSTATKVPTGLDPGEIAFNLANSWLFVGVGGDDILVNGTAVTGYGSTQTVFGVNNVVIPAKPTGKGYEIFRLTDPPPTLAKVFSLTDDLVNAAGGASTSARITAALIAKTAAAGGIAAAGDLKAGDQLVLGPGTGSPFAGISPGGYVYDGSSWLLTGAGVPDATDRTAAGNAGTKGGVYLARATDVVETGAPGSTAPDPLAVPTAAQLKALADRVSSLATSHALLGTYDASVPGIGTPTSSATAGGRTGFTAGALLGAGSGAKAGDYFIVSTGGTVATETGNATALNTALAAGDELFFDGAIWTVIAAGQRGGGGLLHDLGDVSDGSVQTVGAADIKGLLVRDNTIADGLAGAYKLVNVIDCGTIP